jgi:hypothetical protein
MLIFYRPHTNLSWIIIKNIAFFGEKIAYINADTIKSVQINIPYLNKYGETAVIVLYNNYVANILQKLLPGGNIFKYC